MHRKSNRPQYRVQFILGEAFVTTLGYLPVAGGAIYHEGDRYFVDAVDDLGRGRVRAFVRLDPSFRESMPHNCIDAAPVVFSRQAAKPPAASDE